MFSVLFCLARTRSSSGAADVAAVAQNQKLPRMVDFGGGGEEGFRTMTFGV